MTIEEKAKAFVDGLLIKSKSAETVEKMREIIEEIYIQSHRAALTSLLEELPDIAVRKNGTEFIFTDLLKMVIEKKINQ